MGMAMGIMSLPWSLVLALTIAVVSAGDEAALLAFREQISDGGALASWNSSAGFCSWEGVTCSHWAPKRAVALRLDGRALVGALSPALGNLTFLRTLNLSFNWFHGEIPASLGRLRRLQRLDLSDNSFSGTFPVNLSSCVSMTEMTLRNNKLGGRIPTELGDKLASLKVVSLRNNSFTGPIPASLANLSYLQNLDLGLNQLVGSIPPGLGTLHNMRQFTVVRNNLSGMLPDSLYNLSSLELLNVGVNMLHGSIPDDIGSKFPMMKTLALGGNHFTGTIPSSISNISSLVALGLVQNGFSGHVPPTLGKMGALQYLNLADNKLEANDNKGWEFITSLANCSQLQKLILSNNSFGGQLPGSIVNLSTTLQQLYLDDTRISGSIPADIGNLVGLNVVLIANTSISGVIPDSIGKLENLIELGLYNNTLSGLVPSSLGNLSQLNRFYAYNNNLEGPIPASMGELKNLFVLDLSKNHQLNGSIPREIFKLSSLSWYLDLSYNSFSGPIPNDVGSLANLNILILAGNQLSGKIPDSIQNMNKLSGDIPDALASIGNLQELAVDGNVNLCGGTPQLHLAPCSTSLLSKNKKKMQKSLVISLATAGAILLSLSVILLVWILCKRFKQSHKTLSQNLIVDDHYQRIPYQVLLRGTNEFSEVNLLGRGSYGAVYKCVLDNEERTLAVKVFNLGQSRYSKSFETECEAMRRIRHRCLVKIITSCSSINHQGQEFKALIFEFMPNGNLAGWLHPKSQEPATSNTLSLAQRLDIGVDIVDAVEYLHNYCQPLVIHCDLKPSNILLSDNMSARVGDFGISRILQENTSGGMQNSYSSTGIRGSIGYVAPGDWNS
uniref:Protein kinase domain-containing protein n=1 Tax=Aegilops tauschii subsp. strangulata TaxID=200361 RepID=A0A453DX37_AEGTS